jgi:hypothetical protein
LWYRRARTDREQIEVPTRHEEVDVDDQTARRNG